LASSAPAISDQRMAGIDWGRISSGRVRGIIRVRAMTAKTRMPMKISGSQSCTHEKKSGYPRNEQSDSMW
jgi:hypothetical protein